MTAATTQSRSTASRPGWRDVLDLQKEIRAELEAHRVESRVDHEAITSRLTALENNGVKREGIRQGEAKILGMAKSSLAVALAAVSAVVAVISNLKLL